MHYDKKTSYNRIGDRSLTTTRKKIKLILVVIFTFSIYCFLAYQYQEWLLSHNRTLAQMVQKHFKPLEGVPEWQLTIIMK